MRKEQVANGEICRHCLVPIDERNFSLSERGICLRCWNLTRTQAAVQSDAKVGVDGVDASEYWAGPKSALSPDAPTTVTPQGGKHSDTGTAFHHLDPDLMLHLAMILYRGGKKYGRGNWLDIPVEDHLNHALTHIFGFMSGDEQDDHLEHAILRLMFAAVVRREGGIYAAAS